MSRDVPDAPRCTSVGLTNDIPDIQGLPNDLEDIPDIQGLTDDLQAITNIRGLTDDLQA